MNPQTHRRSASNSSKVNLLISLGFHGLVLFGLAYFAAREGLLGKQLKKIAVEMVKETPPEKPKVEEKPPALPPKVETAPAVEAPKAVVASAPEAPRIAPTTTSAVAPPPAFAPPAAEVPAFVFEGGKPVETSSDPIQLYKGFVEFALRSRWARPTDIADKEFVAEIEVTVDSAGRVSQPEWKRSSGNTRWDASVKAVFANVPALERTPPKHFPGRVLVRFDVQEVEDALAQ